MTWASIPLEELCEINVGRTPARANPFFWGRGEPWLSIADMSQGRVITTTKEQISSAGAKGGKAVAPGTVLLSFKLSIGKVAFAGMSLFTNEAIAALPIKRPDLVSPEYLARALESLDLTGGSNRAAMGATLNKAKLRQIQIPLPPLDEQRRIAAILDETDALRAKRRRTLVLLDDLTQSIFLDMFGDAPLAAGLAELSTVQGGLQVSARRVELPLELPYLRVANVHRGRLDLREVKMIKATPAEAQRTVLNHGDLLFVEGHANPLEVGRVAMWDAPFENCLHQNHLIRARCNPDVLLPSFAEAWFNSARGADHFRRAGKTTSGLNTISSATVKTAPLPVPSMSRQLQFEERRLSSMALRRIVEFSRATLDQSFVSLQSRAFSGQLRAPGSDAPIVTGS